MDFATIESLKRLLHEIDANERISKIVLFGEGNHFCSGLDLNEVKTENRDRLVDLIRSNGDWFRSSKLTIAFVQGYAVGLGFELAVACDVLIADESCKFGFLNRRFGVPSFLPLARLRNRIGRQSAIELLDDARLIGSKEALNLGLIKHLIEDHSENDPDEKRGRRKSLQANSLHQSTGLDTSRPSSLDKLESVLDSVQVDMERLEIERGELNSPFDLDRTNEDRLPDEWATGRLHAANYNPNSRHGKYGLSFWSSIESEIQRELTEN